MRRAVIHRVPVASSSVASVGYCGLEQMLEVEFRHGSIYRYLDVPRSAYEALLTADSKGRFLNRSIKGRYGFVRAG